MSLVLAFLAGLLTSLSPCVLPLLPIVVGGALAKHRLGPLVLCGGMGLSFSVLGLVVSLTTEAFGFDPVVIRIAGAVLLLLFGLFLLIPRAQVWMSMLLAPVSSYASNVEERKNSLWGNFVTGSALGAVWSPCSGPTLGVAIGLATQAGTAWRGFAIMLVFGFAASLPLLLIAYGARKLFITYRNRLIVVSTQAKPIFGVVLVVISIAVIFGWDKKFEAATLRYLPESWVNVTTKF